MTKSINPSSRLEDEDAIGETTSDYRASSAIGLHDHDDEAFQEPFSANRPVKSHALLHPNGQMAALRGYELDEDGLAVLVFHAEFYDDGSLRHRWEYEPDGDGSYFLARESVFATPGTNAPCHPGEAAVTTYNRRGETIGQLFLPPADERDVLPPRSQLAISMKRLS